MNPVPPGVAKRLDLFRLADDVVGIAVLHIAAGSGPLEVAVAFDALGRIEVDATALGRAGPRARPGWP